MFKKKENVEPDFFKCLILVYILNIFNQINPEKGK